MMVALTSVCCWCEHVLDARKRICYLGRREGSGERMEVGDGECTTDLVDRHLLLVESMHLPVSDIHRPIHHAPPFVQLNEDELCLLHNVDHRLHGFA
jgi:hypothetical protein